MGSPPSQRRGLGSQDHSGPLNWFKVTLLCVHGQNSA